MFDFDRVIERRGTHSTKWDMIAKLSGITAPDAIPMWVADMDFAAPEGVKTAMMEEIERGAHGYYADTGSWAGALSDWMGKRHGFKLDPAWVSQTPGIVSAMGLIMQATSEPGDETSPWSRSTGCVGIPAATQPPDGRRISPPIESSRPARCPAQHRRCGPRRPFA